MVKPVMRFIFGKLHRLSAGLILCLLLVLPMQAQITELCPADGVQFQLGAYDVGGIILAAFDSADLWVYDIERSTRYPLPNTSPCASNCRLSPDARWLAYVNPDTGIYTQMRLTGTERTPLVSGASDVLWWSADTLLVWTPDHRAYLRPLQSEAPTREYLPVDAVLSVQPGGRWALALRLRDGVFWRTLVNLADPTSTPAFLAEDTPYFNAAAWSPDGSQLAYVGRGAYDPQVATTGAEIYLIRPGSAVPMQATLLSADYGAVRIGGNGPEGLYWSPDGSKLAFWVLELLGPNAETDTAASATLHILDVETQRVTAYCGFSSPDHTPQTPRLVWSPEGTHVAFAGNIPEDNRGYLLLALNTQSGIFTELSEGLFPALGIAQVTAWGYRP